MSCYVKVAVENAAFKFDKLYTYKVQSELATFAVPGARVAVSFGNGKPRVGIIIETIPDTEVKQDPLYQKIKPISDIEKQTPLIDKEFLNIIKYLKQNTFCTYFDAVKAVIPKSNRLFAKQKNGQTSLLRSSHYTETCYKINELESDKKLTPKQQLLYDFLKGSGESSVKEIEKNLHISSGVVKGLEQKGVISKSLREKKVNSFANAGPHNIDSLSPAQDKAFVEISNNIKNNEKPNTTLLHGITGSGKTIIYANLIKNMADAGKSSILLVPEITLATQTIERFKQYFGENVAIIHSKLSDTERLQQWELIRNKGACVVIGTRSAVFAPVKDLGLIIIDEEQEITYFSEQSPRYDTKEVAKLRANFNGAHLVLSSATPSVESYFLARQNTFNLVTLNERYMNMPLPDVHIVDMTKEALSGNTTKISLMLKQEIDKRLANKEQVILLLNRRGYHTIALCSDCKSVVKCKNCDCALVYHKDKEKLNCHYCGYFEPLGLSCKTCGGTIRMTGVGTQRIEEQLSLLFPTARTARLDLDTVSTKNSAQTVLKDFAAAKYDIIVGTQMIAKGLDFKNVTLVGVLGVDQLLLSPSFYANERTFSMITQVVGRSGRGTKEGLAIIQTLDPKNPIIRLAGSQDYESFYNSEIISRKLRLYPPYCKICTVGVTANKESDSLSYSRMFLEILKAAIEKSEQNIPIRVLGPLPMRVSVIQNKFRYKLTIKTNGDKHIKRILNDVLTEVYQAVKTNDINIYIDFGRFSEM